MLLECLLEVVDPRRGQGRHYPLAYILLFSVLAMLCGATSYRKIQRFIKAHRERLNGWFGLQWQRAPAHTSFRYIFQALEPAQLERAFRVHGQQLWEPRAGSDAPPVIALDGKALRGSFDRFQDQKATQILSAFCQRERLILGHLPVSSKTNEIPVAQQLIEELGLQGCLYTLDALHCQKTPSISPSPKAMR
jgi:hypothetical protein